MIVSVGGEPDGAELFVAEDAVASFPLSGSVHAVGVRPVDVVAALGPPHEDLASIIGVPAFTYGGDPVDPALYVLRGEFVQSEPLPWREMAAKQPPIIPRGAGFVLFG